MLRLLALLAAGVALSGCGTTADSVTAAGTTVTTQTQSVGVASPVGAIGAGVGVVAVQPASEAAAPFLGPWSLARNGDRSCKIELGKPNAVGDYTARTQGCATIELARIALWTPRPDGLVLYDFERRPVATLKRSGNGLYDGPMWDGVKLTLWR